MNYSLSSNNKQLLPYEIKCPINRLADIFDFLKENPQTRCNVILNNSEIPEYFEEQMEYIIGITKDNYTIKTKDYKTLVYLLKEKYNAYLSIPATNWESFNILKNLGVSDICVDGTIAFQAEALAKGKDNVKLRMVPTNSFNALLKFNRTETSFYVRPEDLYLYENIIDIVDFQTQDAEIEKTLFEIYNRGTFPHEIKYLINNLLYDTKNIAIRPEFGKIRLNCGQRCEIPGKECHICENALKLGDLTIKILEEKD